MEIDDFSGRQDIADSIKLEAGGLSPRNEVALKNYAKGIMRIIETLYGGYIDHEILEGTKGLENRIVYFGDKDSFTACLHGLGGMESEANTTGGFYDPKEGMDLVAIRPMRDQVLKSENVVKAIAEMHNIPVNRAEAVLEQELSKNTVAHEVLHAYERQVFPSYFMETAQAYYLTRIHEVLSGGQLVAGPNDEKRANFYGQLLQIYGDDLHELTFGLNKDDEFMWKVLSQFSLEVLDELFPGNTFFE